MNLILLATKIETLHESSLAAWGKMSAQQMLEHLIKALRLSQEKIQASLVVSEREAAILKRRTIESPNPMPKNFDNPVVQKQAALEFGSLQEAKAAFHSELKMFYEFFESNPNQMTIHPLFGNMRFEEWQKFHLKHFTHHFTQFGLL